MMATNSQKGFATLTITLVLVSMLVAVSVFVGKVLISDKRITLNEIEYRIAQAAAEKGIAEAMARLKVDPLATSLSGTLSSSAATASYTVTMEKGVPIPGVWQLKSVAILPNGSEATVSVQVAERALLDEENLKRAAPFMLSGNLPANGNITIVANPNGGGPGVPVSVWSKEATTLSGNAKTCSLQAYQDGCNSDTAYSTKNKKWLDIVDNDTNNFPDNLVEYIFNVSDNAAGWAYLESSATAVLNTCSKMAIKDGGFYIIQGVSDCSVSANLGATSPVVIVLKDSDLTISGNYSVYGVVFAYDSHAGVGSKFSVKVNGGARLYGILISNYEDIELPTGSYDAIYDQDVIVRLADADAGSPFVNLNVISGSWKDW
ncbi:pilus assembly PilX N-terminal domain-containing protein [Oceanimonas smirnovii]|uniref:Pilus assembly PilX N-terminal domain-containing protein n=1 Tax=Oceanimonas smirnovii TaxID=264574 RepID=A0ABW7P2M6_9GAMM